MAILITLRNTGINRINGINGARRRLEMEPRVTLLAAEDNVPELLQRRIVPSSIAKGRILRFDTEKAMAIPGGVMIFTQGNRPELSEKAKVHNLAEYHMPVNADIDAIDVLFVHEDQKASPIGAKGLGEIGIVGTGAAIANATYHVTGRRVRDLPITREKVLGIG